MDAHSDRLSDFDYLGVNPFYSSDRRSTFPRRRTTELELLDESGESDSDGYRYLSFDRYLWALGHGYDGGIGNFGHNTYLVACIIQDYWRQLCRPSQEIASFIGRNYYDEFRHSCSKALDGASEHRWICGFGISRGCPLYIFLALPLATVSVWSSWEFAGVETIFVSNMNTSRTLIIGLDGATFSLINPLVQAGCLPALARLMTQGVHGHMWTWPNMNSEAGWTSLVTGYNSGQHGIYHLATHTQRDYTWRLASAADRKKEPFWCLLSAAGQRVGIINVPLSYPADPVNGFMLSGMHTPDIHSPGFAHPPDLLDELHRQGIDYIIDVLELADLCRRNPQRALQAAQHVVDVRSRTILHLMKTRPWDVLLAVFAVTDILQHFFWPDEDIPIENDAWTPMRSIYQQIDLFLGDALDLIDENTTVLVVSDHGFGPAYFGKECLNQLFARLGLLHYRQSEQWSKSQLLNNLLFYG